MGRLDVATLGGNLGPPPQRLEYEAEENKLNKRVQSLNQSARGPMIPFFRETERDPYPHRPYFVAPPLRTGTDGCVFTHAEREDLVWSIIEREPAGDMPSDEVGVTVSFFLSFFLSLPHPSDRCVEIDDLIDLYGRCATNMRGENGRGRTTAPSFRRSAGRGSTSTSCARQICVSSTSLCTTHVRSRSCNRAGAFHETARETLYGGR